MNTMSEIIYYKICSSIYIFFYAFFFLGGLSHSVSVSHLALEGPFRSWLVAEGQKFRTGTPQSRAQNQRLGGGCPLWREEATWLPRANCGMGRNRPEDRQTASMPLGPGRAPVEGRIKEHPPAELRKGLSLRMGRAGSKMARCFRDSGGQGLRRDRWIEAGSTDCFWGVREKGWKEIEKCTFGPRVCVPLSGQTAEVWHPLKYQVQLQTPLCTTLVSMHICIPARGDIHTHVCILIIFYMYFISIFNKEESFMPNQ